MILDLEMVTAVRYTSRLYKLIEDGLFGVCLGIGRIPSELVCARHGYYHTYDRGILRRGGRADVPRFIGDPRKWEAYLYGHIDPALSCCESCAETCDISAKANSGICG